jgi:hypothetical protein
MYGTNERIDCAETIDRASFDSFDAFGSNNDAFSVTRICSRTRIWPACVKFRAVDHPQFDFLFSAVCVTV